MAVEWQSRDFLTDWTGLYNRLQSIDVPPSYSRTARNVDFYGSALGKRQGTQIVNGWASLATGPVGAWSSAGTNLTGPVVDASGFRVGDTAFFVNPAGGPISTAQIAGLPGGNVVQFNTWSTPGGAVPVPGQTAVVVRRDLGGRIDGLYHAVFRDGTEQLLASVGGSIWNVWATSINLGASYAPGLLTTKFATVTVAFANWSALNSGQISNPETLVAAGIPGNPSFPAGATYADVAAQNPSALPPDIIQIISSGGGGHPIAGTVLYEGTIAGFDHSNPNTITLNANCSVAPIIGDLVVFFPHGSHASGTDTRFTMFNNRVYVSFAGAANGVHSGPALQVGQRQPPVVIEQPSAGGTPYVRRMGIRPPTTPPHATAGGSGVAGTGTRYRFTYVNSLNGQESEGSPESNDSIVGPGPPPGPSSSVSITLYSSPDPQVDTINIYRTLAGPQDGAWYFVASVPNGGASGYTDVVTNTDDKLGPILRTFTNEPPPDTTTVLAVWTQAGALIGIDSTGVAHPPGIAPGQGPAGGEQVVWSDAPDIVNGVYKCESWPINNTLFVNRDDGDHLVGLGVFYDSVVVWKGRSMHRIVGAPPDIILQPISFRDDHTGVGIWSAKGFIMDQDVAIFVSDDGFYQVTRYDGVQQGFTSSRISRQIDQEFYVRTGFSNSMLRANREKSHLLYHRVRRRLQAFVPVDGNANPTDIFVYQVEGTVDGTPHGWSLWSTPTDYSSAGNPGAVGSFVSASCMVNSMAALDLPYYGCGGQGLVVKADWGAGEWQSFPVTIMSDTVWFSGGGAGVVCRCRAVDFVFIATAGMPVPILRVGTDFDTPDRYQLPALAQLGMPTNENPLILELGQYLSIGLEETSVTGLFLVEDFTLWFQRLPVGVTPRLIPTPLFQNPGGPAATP